jgi:phospholipase C
MENDCYYPNTTETDPITDDNIFRELNNAGISWKVYAQSYAAAGGTPTTPDNANGTDYYRRHNGATWYSDILSNVDGSASKIVDLSQLTTDLNDGTSPAS